MFEVMKECEKGSNNYFYFVLFVSEFIYLFL